jgi:hypothetical protein
MALGNEHCRWTCAKILTLLKMLTKMLIVCSLSIFSRINYLGQIWGENAEGAHPPLCEDLREHLRKNDVFTMDCALQENM